MSQSNDTERLGSSELSSFARFGLILPVVFALVGPATGDEAACEAALADYYFGHTAPDTIASGYAASKAAFDHSVDEGSKASIAALRFFNETGSTSEAILGVSRAIHDAIDAATDAADKAERARALWGDLEAGTSRHSAQEAVSIEHGAFMSAVYFVRAGKDSLDAFFTAVAHATGADDARVFDVLDSAMDADSDASIYEALAEFEAIGITGIGKFIGAFKAFHDASKAAVLSAKKAAVTLETMTSFTACQ